MAKSLTVLSHFHQRLRTSNLSLAHLGSASFSTSKSNKDGNSKQSFPSVILHAPEVETTSRSIGQVIFLNSPKSGNVILASLALADPMLAILATFGAGASVGTSTFLGLDENKLKNGLLGYNGFLIGCASSVFTSSLPFAVLGTLAGAIATPLVSASLNNMTTVPQWTWSFNFVMLTGLVRSRPLMAETATEEAIQLTTSFSGVLISPLTGISQIFVVNSPLSGMGILAAASLYSPGLALHALGGSTVGCLVGLTLGADVSNVAAGLWGYNSALTSMAIGTFYNDSVKTRMFSFGAAAGAAVLFDGKPYLSVILINKHITLMLANCL